MGRKTIGVESTPHTTQNQGGTPHKQIVLGWGHPTEFKDRGGTPHITPHTTQNQGGTPHKKMCSDFRCSHWDGDTAQNSKTGGGHRTKG